MRKTHVLVVSICLLISILAVRVGYAESRIFVAPKDPSERLEDLIEGRIAPGPSIYSQTIALDECRWALTDQGARLLSAGRRIDLLHRCSGMAVEIASRAPSFAYAWYIAAYAAGEAGDKAALNERLVLSQATSPAELWLCARRLALAERFRADLTDQARAAEEHDIRVHLFTEAGAEAIALRMVQDADFSERAAEIAGSMSDKVQRRLVRKVSYVLDNLARRR